MIFVLNICIYFINIYEFWSSLRVWAWTTLFLDLAGTLDLSQAEEHQPVSRRFESQVSLKLLWYHTMVQNNKVCKACTKYYRMYCLYVKENPVIQKQKNKRFWQSKPKQEVYLPLKSWINLFNNIIRPKSKMNLGRPGAEMSI